VLIYVSKRLKTDKHHFWLENNDLGEGVGEYI
jgi:hypothetical protein